MKKDFYLFRHGQTDMNVAGRWQGQGIDLPLNDVGIKQAQKLAKELKKTGMEVIFSSPLKRAVQTAEIVAETLDLSVRIDAGLIEGRFGVAEGKTKQEIACLFPETAKAWHNLEGDFMDVCFTGGETKREIQRRILKTLTKIALENDYTVIGVSAHSAVIRCFVLLFGLKLYTVPHSHPFHLCFEKNNFELVSG